METKALQTKRLLNDSELAEYTLGNAKSIQRIKKWRRLGVTEWGEPAPKHVRPGHRTVLTPIEEAERVIESMPRYLTGTEANNDRGVKPAK